MLSGGAIIETAFAAEANHRCDSISRVLGISQGRDARSRNPPRPRYRPGPSKLMAPASQLIQIPFPMHLALEFQKFLEAPTPGILAERLVDHVRLRLPG